MKKLTFRYRQLLIRKSRRGQSPERRIGRIKPKTRERIKAPLRMDFDENYIDTAKFLEKIRRYTLIHKLHTFIDLIDVRELSPDVALVLAAEIQRSMALYPGCIDGRNPRRSRPKRLLRNLKFHELLGFHAEEVLTDEEAGIEYIHMECGSAGRTDFFPTIIKLVLGGKARPSNVNAKNKLTEAWNEALANATQHAYDCPPEMLKYPVSDHHRWWMAGYRDSRRKEAIFMVYDQGMTIPKDLPRRWGESLSGLAAKAGGLVRLGKGSIDDELLMQAMTIGRTRITEHEGRGWGFSNMHELLGGYTSGGGNRPLDFWRELAHIEPPRPIPISGWRWREDKRKLEAVLGHSNCLASLWK